MNEQVLLGLVAAPPSGTVVINSRCTVRSEGDQRLVVVAGLPVHHYGADDLVGAAYAMVFLEQPGVRSGICHLLNLHEELPAFRHCAPATSRSWTPHGR